MQQRHPRTHTELNEIFFGYEISFKILLFENIWPVTIYSGPGQKHTGVLLPFSIVLFL